MASTTRRSARAAFLTAALIGLAACATPTAVPTTPPSSTPSPPGSCAWPTELDVKTSNTYFPDSAAFYWLQPLAAGADTQIVISGEYPDARYAALSVYLPNGSPFTSDNVGSSRPDYRIAPDPGSTNPWQHSAAPGGRFTVTISSRAAAAQPNMLPMPPGTTSAHPGYLAYRVYLPADGQSAHIPLPTLTIHDGHSTRPLQRCRNHNAPIPALVRNTTPTPSNSPTTTPPQLTFYKPSQGFTVNAALPNADTSYALAYFGHAATSSDVVVVTGKAPMSAQGSHPSPWPNPDTDMRYWSMCIALASPHVPTVVNTLPSGQADYGCRADDATARNAAGDYTYVIGTEAQRAAIERVPSVTFLPFATDQTTPVYVLLLRNTLVNPAFPYSTANITQTGDPTAAATAMGAYYPHISVCPLTAVTANGCSS